MTDRKKAEEIRKKALLYRIIGFSMFILGFVSIVFIGFTFGFFGLGGMLGIFLASGIGIFLIILSTKLEYDYRREIKHVYLVATLEKLFSDIEYDFDNGFSKDFVRQTEMVKMGNRYSSNDLISGRYQNIPFQMSDLLIQDESSDSDGTTSTVTLFSGQWFVFEFNKNFTGYLQLRERNNRLFKSGKPYSFFSQRESTKEIKFENEEFNREFTAYGSDSHEAFYLITPHFMEKLMNLKAQMEGELIIGFIDNKLHIAHDSRVDMFEPSIWRALNDEYIREAEEDLRVITSIVDELGLDN